LILTKQQHHDSLGPGRRACHAAGACRGPGALTVALRWQWATMPAEPRSVRAWHRGRRRDHDEQHPARERAVSRVKDSTIALPVSDSGSRGHHDARLPVPGPAGPGPGPGSVPGAVTRRRYGPGARPGFPVYHSIGSLPRRTTRQDRGWSLPVSVASDSVTTESTLVTVTSQRPFAIFREQL